MSTMIMEENINHANPYTLRVDDLWSKYDARKLMNHCSNFRCKYDVRKLMDLCSEYEARQLMEDMLTTIKEVEESEYYRSMVKMLKYNKNIGNYILRVQGSCGSVNVDEDKETRDPLKIAVYGTGSIQFSYTAQYQLSLAILLRRDFPQWIGGLIETYDICMTPIDVKVMEALGCGVKVVDEYHPCVRRVNEPTLLIMFNLDYTSIQNFLLANWSPSHLKKMVILTGSYQFSLVEILRRISKSSHDETAELVQSIIECVTEFNIYGRCPKKGYRIRRTNQFKVTSKNIKWPFYFKLPDIKICPFRNLTWHFFNSLPDEVYQLEALLPETKLEKMRRLRDGEEKDVIKIMYVIRILTCLKEMSYDEDLLHKREVYPAGVLKDHSDLSRYPSRPSRRKWCPPSTGWIKLNFSAVSSAAFENNQVVSYGGVFFNENEECLHRYTGSLLERHDEIDVALDDLDFGNAKALRKGLRCFMDMLSTRTRPITDGRKLVIEGDSVSIVRWANGIYPPPKRLVEVFKEIHVLMCGFQCMIFHVYPEANSIAIEIANQGVMCMA